MNTHEHCACCGKRMSKRDYPNCHFGNRAYPCIPETNISLLTDTSKMPSYSWGLPAGLGAFCPRAFGSICDHCYAQKGRYVMQNVKDAQNARADWLLLALRSEEGTAKAIATIVDAIKWACNKRGVDVFRVHDSGDLFSVKYVQMWAAIAKALPEVKFWFPTRVYQIRGSEVNPNDKLMLAVQELASLPNVTVRPSALDVDAPAPVIDGLAAGSTAHTPGKCENGAIECPAYKNDGKCGNCRMCWNGKVAISYKLH